MRLQTLVASMYVCGRVNEHMGHFGQKPGTFGSEHIIAPSFEPPAFDKLPLKTASKCART